MRESIPDFISHYYEERNGPLRSLSDNTKDGSREILRQLIEKGEGINSRRTLDYIETRIEVENWLREEFKKKGGKPLRKNPHYFILGTCDWLLKWYTHGRCFKKQLADIDPRTISITYPDSMISYHLHRAKKSSGSSVHKKHYRDYHGKVFVFEELEGLIRKYGLPKGRKEDGDYDLYIEVQVWDDQ